MVVEPDTFHEHIKQVKQLFTILPLPEWVERYQSGKPLPPKACAITFDDGWSDNFEYAFPIIQQEQVPATLFAVSEMIGSRQQFWPNQLSDTLEQLPIEKLQALPWLRRYLPPSFSRPLSRDQLSSLIQQLKQFPDSQIHQWLAETREQFDLPPNKQAALADWDQLRMMSNSGLVDIGSHTCHHYRLRDDLDYATMEMEIRDSQATLQKELEKPVDLFCYPNGDITPAAEKLVQQYYRAAVTTNQGINTAKGSQLSRLSRIGLHQDSSDSQLKFQARLSGWL